MLGEEEEVILLREREAVVLRTVQLYKRVHVRQLPELLTETGVFLGGINPSRELKKLEECGYLQSSFHPKRRGLTMQLRVYRITKRGEKALKEYQKHLRRLADFLERFS